ncbi:MAG: tetratricopeptide repeat protein, partial [Myxococcota bacterium]
IAVPIEELTQEIISANLVRSHKVGLHAEVTVVEQSGTGTIALRISGKADASIKPDGNASKDLPHQVMAGHLPMILHPDPQRVLTLGLGGGVTLGTLTTYPVRLIDNLEISQEVIDAARVYFKKANRGALDNHPKVRHVVGDGRNHLQFTTETYDVITSVPSNPWIAGIGNLFTTEFFEICRRRLADDGLICQWIHKINLRSQDLKTVIRTFTTVFGEHAQLWDLGYDCLLIGSKSPIRLDVARLRNLFKNPEFSSDLDSLGIVDASSLLRHYRMDAAGMTEWAGEGRCNTDSFPILEFECPKGMYGHEFDAYRNLIRTDYSKPDGSWIDGLEKEKLADAQIRQEAFQHLELTRVLQQEFLDVLKRRGLSTFNKSRAASISRDEKAKMRQRAVEIISQLDKLYTSLQISPDAWLSLRGTLIGRKVAANGADLQEILLNWYTNTAMASEMQVNPPEVAGYLERALKYSHGKPEVTRKLSILLAQTCLYRLEKPNGPRRGIAGMRRVIELYPNDAGIVELYGVLHAAAGDNARAEPILKRALELSGGAVRNASSIHQNLGKLYIQLGNAQSAIRHLEEAILVDPDNEQAKKILEAFRSQDEP